MLPGRSRLAILVRRTALRGLVLAIAVAGGAGIAAAQTVRSADITPSSSAHKYVITTTDLVMGPSLSIENVGVGAISGIRLIANGRDLTSIDAILATILADGMTDEQRARAIWQFARTHAYAWFPYSEFDAESADPVRFFNSYGYGLCSDFSAAMASLYFRAGFPVRVWAVGFPSGHIVPEVYYDNAWHVMDANRDVLFLARDNRTIAGMETLIDDPWLIDRAGGVYADLRDLYTSTPLGAFSEVTSASGSLLHLDLRPGERVEYLANPIGLFRQDTTTPWGTPLSYGNAILSSQATAGVQAIDALFEAGHGLQTVSDAGVATWRPAIADAPARHAVSLPHPLLQATLQVTTRLPAATDRVRVYGARSAAGVTLSQGDLASGAVFDNPVVVSHNGLATIDDDGLFPVLHVGPSGAGALVVRAERTGGTTPLIVGGTFFRFTDLDGLAIDVSSDGATWLPAWVPASEDVGYLVVSEDATSLVGAATSVYVRYRFDARSAGGWAAGAVELSVAGVGAVPTTLIGTLIATEARTQTFDLTALVAPSRGAASYGYVLRFEFEGTAGIEGFGTSNVMQVAPERVPAPGRGTTPFEVIVEAGQASDLRLHHTWSELETLAPLPPVEPLRPARGESMALSGPLAFSFVPSPAFPASHLRMYELEVCADATCGSPLSTVTLVRGAAKLPGPDGLLGTGDDEYDVSTTPEIIFTPFNWLQSGRTYYWRVRTLSLMNEWSAYSDTWSFVAAPGSGGGLTLSFDGPTGVREATAPTVTLGGEVFGASGSVWVRWTTDRGASGELITTGAWDLPAIPLGAGDTEITVVAVDERGQSVTAHLDYHVPYFSYFLAEGSTQADFSTELVVVNPSLQPAPIAVHLMLDNGTTFDVNRVLAPMSRLTLLPEDFVGMGKAFAIEVRSTDTVPLAVERTMRWGPGFASGHSGSAVSSPSTTWYFAEGSQGYFDTFVLLANPNATPTLANVSFMTESGQTVTHVVTIPARARETVWTRQFPQLTNRSFSITVTGNAPLVAERAVYFGQPTWKGGHVSSGAPTLAQRWFCPEGATGPYLDTYVLVGNPSFSTPAPVTVEYLTGTGDIVSEQFVVAPHTRLTIDLESRSPLLANAAVSTVVTSTSPVVVERATYWGGAFTNWIDGTSSMGTTGSATTWAVADVRVGGRDAYETWLLLTNENDHDIEVDLTVLPESGAATTVRVLVPRRARYNYYVNGELPDLAGQRVGVKLAAANGDLFAVERSQYWTVNGVSWSGGTSSRATVLP